MKLQIHIQEHCFDAGKEQRIPIDDISSIESGDGSIAEGQLDVYLKDDVTKLSTFKPLRFVYE